MDSERLAELRKMVGKATWHSIMDNELRQLLNEIERMQIEQEEDELFYKSSIESFKSSIERVVIEVEKLKAENTLLYTKLNECIKHTEQAEAQAVAMRKAVEVAYANHHCVGTSDMPPCPRCGTIMSGGWMCCQKCELKLLKEARKATAGTALLNRMKRMEKALTELSHNETAYCGYHAYTEWRYGQTVGEIAQKALSEDVQE